MSINRQLTIDASGIVVDCREDTAVLSALATTAGQPVPVGCRSGGCGVCRVQVLAGRFECGLMSREQVSETEQARGIALACRLYPRSDLTIRPIGKLVARFNQSTAELIRRLHMPGGSSSRNVQRDHDTRRTY